MGYYKLYRQAPQGKAIRGILYRCQGGLINSVSYERIASTLENDDFKIPALIYPVIVNHSPRFNKPLPLICQVPNRKGIRIHGGTKPEHSKGCILITNRQECSKLFAQLMCEQSRKEDIRLEIIDFKPGDPAPKNVKL